MTDSINITNPPEKQCTKCKEYFPATSEFFYKKTSVKQELRPCCKYCVAQYLAKNKEKIAKNRVKYRANNKEKIAKSTAKYLSKNKEKIAKNHAKYQVDNKEKIAKYRAKYQVDNKEKRAQYVANNKEKIAKSNAKYCADNKEKIAKNRAKYCIENKEKITKYAAKYNAENQEKRAEGNAKYRADNKEKIAKGQAKAYVATANYKTYAPQLSGIEETRQSKDIEGAMEVTCAYCGKWFLPTNGQVANRVAAINETGGKMFYCSEGCKFACPVFHRIKYPKGFKKASSRESNPILRQLVLKRDNYTCQKCGITIGGDTQLHCHHVLPARQNPMTANDTDNCTTLCKKCHIEVHKKPGCKNHELKCEGSI